ncbi:MAG: hypothetical protein GY861_05280 [bacterium]|nr:hypothetical protein [bacterium]
MAGVKGRSGRKTIKTEREIKEELQEMIPEAYEAIRDGLVGRENKRGIRATTAFKLLAKFIGDKQSVKVDADVKVDSGVVVLPALKTDSKKSDKDDVE